MVYMVCSRRRVHASLVRQELYLRLAAAVALCVPGSRFKEVLLLDCDVVLRKDPAYMFDAPLYKERGNYFWGDIYGYGMVKDEVFEYVGAWYCFNLAPAEAAGIFHVQAVDKHLAPYLAVLAVDSQVLTWSVVYLLLLQA